LRGMNCARPAHAHQHRTARKLLHKKTNWRYAKLAIACGEQISSDLPLKADLD
jgi:hypothetical protein